MQMDGQIVFKSMQGICIPNMQRIIHQWTRRHSLKIYKGVAGYDQFRHAFF